MPNRVEALRNRVALYRSYLRVGARGDLAIQYMRQIADDLDEISKAKRSKPGLLGGAGRSADLPGPPVPDLT